jgi:hypothetical protein
MGRIFICAIYGGYEGAAGDPEASGRSTNGAKEMVFLRDAIVPELRNRGFEVLAVPDSDNPRQSIDWIDKRAKPGDIALGIHADAYAQSQTGREYVLYCQKWRAQKSRSDAVAIFF